MHHNLIANILNSIKEEIQEDKEYSEHLVQLNKLIRLFEEGGKLSEQLVNKDKTKLVLDKHIEEKEHMVVNDGAQNILHSDVNDKDMIVMKVKEQLEGPNKHPMIEAFDEKHAREESIVNASKEIVRLFKEAEKEEEIEAVEKQIQSIGHLNKNNTVSQSRVGNIVQTNNPISL